MRAQTASLVMLGEIFFVKFLAFGLDFLDQESDSLGPLLLPAFALCFDLDSKLAYENLIDKNIHKLRNFNCLASICVKK